MLKYIFVSGGVISGIGKGTTVSSIALLLKAAGYKVTPLKFENYLNIDAGTINPIEHGDPFLCEDGTEADMDIGSYEKFLNQEMGKVNFVTMGQIYKEVIDKERRFEYNGEDVEGIPHITDEIIKRINTAAKETNAEIMIIELGGTAGEYQNVFYYEASRILTLRNPKDVIHVHVSYVPTPKHLGEPKTKPIQLSVRTLNSMGIQPDILIARSENPLDKRRIDRFAMFCNMESDDIISNPDVNSVYEIPLTLYKQNVHNLILSKLSLKKSKTNISDWDTLVKKIKRKKNNKIRIAIVGKYFGTGEYKLKDSYAALFDAIDHASWECNTEVLTEWIDAEEVEKKGIKVIGNPDGIIVPIGWGERGAEGMITTAGYARKNKIPYLGLCYGLQHAVISFARDVLKLKDANTTENNQKTKHPVIDLIPSQKQIMKNRAYGGTMRLGAWDAKVQINTKTYGIYKKYKAFKIENQSIISERHRHRYEFNNKYLNLFQEKGLIISATSVIEGLVEIIELPSNVHPFYIATQGHPEYKSKPNLPHPLFIEFIKSCIVKKN
ncbi:MAG: CTP synthase (glutamine hydrolyzing) [bacterium]|nr:CTP synthase (glutamine hydrolyzing) [bacterium]